MKEEIAGLHQKIEHMAKELQKKSQRSEDEQYRRLKHAEETIVQLQRRLANTKQVESLSIVFSVYLH